MSVSNQTMYRYIQSVAMPFAYPGNFVPGISIGSNRYVKEGTIAPRTYTLGTTDVLEVLLISPNYYLANTLYCKPAVLLSKLNPSSTTTLESRYGMANDVFQEYEVSGVPTYLRKASGRIISTGAMRCEVVTYTKTVSDTPVTIENLTTTGLASSMIYNVPGNHQFWINAFPQQLEKRCMAVGVYLPAQSLHQLVRISNVSGNNIQVNLTGVMLLEKTDPSFTTIPTVISQTPFGLTNYILERLRNSYSFVVYNPYDPVAVVMDRQLLITRIKSVIKDLSTEWYDMLKAIPGINLKKLINFVIFHLE